jgi:hypothetical protein
LYQNGSIQNSGYVGKVTGLVTDNFFVQGYNLIVCESKKKIAFAAKQKIAKW